MAGDLSYGQLLKKQLTFQKMAFHIIFWGLHWGIFAYGWWKQDADVRLAPLNLLRWSVWISRGAGLVLTFDGTFILIPVCRTIMRFLRPKIRWLPLDENLWFHRQVAYAMLFFTAIHTLGHYVNFYNVERTQLRPALAVQIHYMDAGGVTGHIMLLCMLLMYTTAHAKIRQQSFETFWYTHHLFIPFMLGLYTHATGCFVRDTALPVSPFAGKEFWDHCIGYLGWRWELFAGGFYLFERLYREIRAHRSTKITRVVRHPYDVVEIQFEKPSFRYKAGQWLFLQVPSISSYQWHPFTITSCPFDPYVSVHVRQVGDFTRALGDAVGAGSAQAKMYEDSQDPNLMYEVALQNGQEMPRIRIDGPYGAPAEDVFENEIAILIGTGIGVTPWASILKNIWHLRNSPNPPTRLRRVEFIWVCKDTTSFEWFHSLLSSLESQSADEARMPGAGDEFLRIHTYLTQKLDMNTAQNIVLNSVGADLDPLTELKARTNFGRPNFLRLFEGIRDGIVDRTYMGGLDGSMQTTVGVYFCGPSAAARDIKKSCKTATVADVKFRFWKEHF